MYTYVVRTHPEELLVNENIYEALTLQALVRCSPVYMPRSNWGRKKTIDAFKDILSQNVMKDE